MKKIAIIVAAGRGSRMGSDTPKQFLELNGLPVLAHSIKAFHEYEKNLEIIVALNAVDMPLWQMLRKKYKFDIPHISVEGGEHRFHSVQNAINWLSNGDSLVAIHDAARPYVSSNLIGTCFAEAEIHQNAVPAVTVKDSLRIKNGNNWIRLDRNLVKAVQTPQVFRLRHLIEAYKVQWQPDFTDDATVVEKTGQCIHIIDGEDSNIKITTKADLP